MISVISIVLDARFQLSFSSRTRTFTTAFGQAETRNDNVGSVGGPSLVFGVFANFSRLTHLSLCCVCEKQQATIASLHRQQEGVCALDFC